MTCFTHFCVLLAKNSGSKRKSHVHCNYTLPPYKFCESKYQNKNHEKFENEIKRVRDTTAFHQRNFHVRISLSRRESFFLFVNIVISIVVSFKKRRIEWFVLLKRNKFFLFVFSMQKCWIKVFLSRWNNLRNCLSAKRSVWIREVWPRLIHPHVCFNKIKKIIRKKECVTRIVCMLIMRTHHMNEYDNQRDNCVGSGSISV